MLFWITSGFPEVPAMLSQNIPPTFFPRLVLTVIALLSVFLVVKGLGTTRESKKPISKRVFVTAAVITGAVVLMQPLGVWLTVSLLAIVMPFAWGERSYRRLAILALALPLGIYVTFTLALGIRFPAGLLAMLSR